MSKCGDWLVGVCWHFQHKEASASRTHVRNRLGQMSTQDYVGGPKNWASQIQPFKAIEGHQK